MNSYTVIREAPAQVVLICASWPGSSSSA